MNVLIIDTSKRSAQIMRKFLAKGIPDVGVTEYDPDQQGALPHGFNWSTYDVQYGATDAPMVARARQGTSDGQGYEFKRLIGQGAMSRVYLGERLSDQLTVVVKIMDGTLSGEDESVQRFVQEAALA
jgi:serine/threonine protein kinase